METILEYLDTSFDDGILSKSEKKALKETINEQKPTKRELDWLRSKIFDLAKDKINGIENENILNWLEDANKLILPKLHEETFSKVYFSPGNDCLNAITEQIGCATKSIDICVFTISDDRIYDKIKYAHSRGIKIRIISDDEKVYDKGSDIKRLADRGIPTKVDNSPHHMHHKFAVFDNETLLTGSFNWTRSATEHNQENILITNDKKAVSEYRKKFDQMWDMMQKL